MCMRETVWRAELYAGQKFNSFSFGVYLSKTTPQSDVTGGGDEKA